MSQYTTGELAKLCDITVRTVQYYDTRGLLNPSALSEGGRRLYSEGDVRRMKIICFLRDLGFSLDAIGKLLAEEDPGSVIALLLDQQEQALAQEVREREEQLAKLHELRKGLRDSEAFSVESIGDIAYIMQNKQKLKKLHRNLLLSALPLSVLQVAGIVLWAWKGIWWPFALWALLAIPGGIFLSRKYFQNTAYICPKCHEVFKPDFWQAFWASHTPNTRRLTCPHCGHKGSCVEVWGGD